MPGLAVFFLTAMATLAALTALAGLGCNAWITLSATLVSVNKVASSFFTSVSSLRMSASVLAFGVAVFGLSAAFGGVGLSGGGTGRGAGGMAFLLSTASALAGVLTGVLAGALTGVLDVLGVLTVLAGFSGGMADPGLAGCVAVGLAGMVVLVTMGRVLTTTGAGLGMDAGFFRLAVLSALRKIGRASCRERV